MKKTFDEVRAMLDALNRNVSGPITSTHIEALGFQRIGVSAATTIILQLASQLTVAELIGGNSWLYHTGDNEIYFHTNTMSGTSALFKYVGDDAYNNYDRAMAIVGRAK